MSDVTNDFEVGTDADDNEISSYSTETDSSVAAEPARRPSASAPGGATGRRCSDFGSCKFIFSIEFDLAERIGAEDFPKEWEFIFE